MRLIAVLSVALLLALLNPSLSYAADLLPGEAIGEDTVAVVWLDLMKVDAKQLGVSAAALLGAEAKGLTDSLGEVEKVRLAFVDAGAKQVAFIFRGPDANGRAPEPFVLVPLAEKSDPDAALKAIQKALGDQPPIAKLSDRALVIASPRWPPQAVEPGEAHKAFEKALRDAGDSPASVIFIPNDALRKLADGGKANVERMEQGMPGFGSIMTLMIRACEMKQITATTQLGTEPKLVVAAEAADADAAKALVEQMKAAGEGFAKLAAAARGAPARPGQIVRAPAEALIAFDLINGLLTKSKINAVESRVVATVEGDLMKETATGLAKFAQLARENAKQVMVANQMRQLHSGIISYGDDHNKLPDKLDEIADYVGGKEALAKLLKHPVTGDKVGFSYVKPARAMRDIQRPHITAMLFEMKDGKIDATGWTGYADGHVTRNPPAAPPGDEPFDQRQ